jgi:hypothetical protein
MASATTAQLLSRSAFNLASLRTSLPRPFSVELMASSVWAMGTPINLTTQLNQSEPFVTGKPEVNYIKLSIFRYYEVLIKWLVLNLFILSK